MPVHKNIHTVRCTNISYLQQSFIYLEKVNFVLLHVAHRPAATPNPTRLVVVYTYIGTFRYLHTKPVSNDKRVSGYQLCRETEPSRGCAYLKRWRVGTRDVLSSDGFCRAVVAWRRKFIFEIWFCCRLVRNLQRQVKFAVFTFVKRM